MFILSPVIVQSPYIPLRLSSPWWESFSLRQEVSWFCLQDVDYFQYQQKGRNRHDKPIQVKAVATIGVSLKTPRNAKQRGCSHMKRADNIAATDSATPTTPYPRFHWFVFTIFCFQVVVNFGLVSVIYLFSFEVANSVTSLVNTCSFKFATAE